MITAIAVWLWIFDVILDGDDGDVILADQHVSDSIDVIDKGTDDADSGYIVQFVHHGFETDRKVSALQLFYDTDRFFDTGFDHLDGIPLVFDGKLIV